MKAKGFALVTVLLIVLILMVTLFGTISIASRNLFFTSGFRYRTTALYAAEAGVVRAMKEVENNPSFAGKLEGVLDKSNSKFTAMVEKDASTGDIIVTSTGTCGPFSRTIEATLRPSAASYNAITNDGPIFFNGDVVIDAIESIVFPRKAPGNIHTNCPDIDAIDAGNDAHIRITGIASAMGKITHRISRSHAKENSDCIQVRPLDKAKFVNREFPKRSIPCSGIVSQNTKIEGNLVVNGLLRLQNGAVLYVKGDLVLKNGVVGKGSIVADGDVVIKGTVEIRNDSASRYIVIYTDGNLVLASDDARETADGDWESTSNDPIPKLFSQMPYNAPIYICHNLPEDVPRGIEFFRWYSQNKDSNEPEIIRWRDGVPGNPEYPGLPKEVKEWLDKSTQYVDRLEEWYRNNEY